MKAHPSKLVDVMPAQPVANRRAGDREIAWGTHRSKRFMLEICPERVNSVVASAGCAAWRPKIVVPAQVLQAERVNHFVDDAVGFSFDERIELNVGAATDDDADSPPVLPIRRLKDACIPRSNPRRLSEKVRRRPFARAIGMELDRHQSLAGRRRLIGQRDTVSIRTQVHELLVGLDVSTVLRGTVRQEGGMEERMAQATRARCFRGEHLKPETLLFVMDDDVAYVVRHGLRLDFESYPRPAKLILLLFRANRELDEDEVLPFG